MPGVAAYKLNKTIGILKKELDGFDEVRQKLLTEYGKPSEENPQQYVFESEEMRLKFEVEIAEILAKEVTENFPKISEADLANVSISAAELNTITWMID